MLSTTSAGDSLLRELVTALDRLVGFDGPVIALEDDGALIELRYWLARGRHQVERSRELRPTAVATA